MVTLAIYKDGSFKIIYEDETSADQLVKDEAAHETNQDSLCLVVTVGDIC